MNLRRLLPDWLRRFLIIYVRDRLPSAAIDLEMKHFGTDKAGWMMSPLLNEHSIVYSFGLGEDISFDLTLINDYALHVWGFDPTPAALDYVRGLDLPMKFHLMAYGIADHDGVLRFAHHDDPTNASYSAVQASGKPEQIIELPVKRLCTIMDELGHTFIDVLKLDIEGSEYAVLGDMLDSKVVVRQILVEFHHRFKGVGAGQTRRIIKRLNEAGYVIAHRSRWGAEYTFVEVY